MQFFHFQDAHIHYLSEREVDEAFDLAEQGLQRLIFISAAKKTVVIFLVRTADHSAKVIVIVSPEVRQDSRYPSYEVCARFEPCCAEAEGRGIDQEFRERIQLIYDTYIQAVRRTFDAVCCQRSLNRTATEEPCAQEKQNFFGQLTEQPTGGAVSASRGICSTPGPSETSLTQLEGDESSSESRVKQSRKRKRQPSGEVSKLQAIANSLVRKAIRGMEKIVTGANPRPNGRNPAKPSTGQDENEQLRALEQLFDDRAKAIEDKTKAEVWINWYCAACVALIRHLKGYCKRDRRASGSFVVNGIVNHLLETEGAKAFAVIAAYAEQAHYLWDAANLSETDQKKVSLMVADKLRGRLATLPGHYSIPFPAFVICASSNGSFESTCSILGLPRLFALGLAVGDIDTTANGCSVQYSTVVASFAKVADDLHAYRTGHVLEDMPPANEGRMNMSRSDVFPVEDSGSTESDPVGEEEDWLALFADTADNIDLTDSMWGAGVRVAPG